MCHVTVVFDPLRLLGSFTFFQVPVASKLSNEDMPWFCRLMNRLKDRHWLSFCHCLSMCMHALLGQG